MSSPRIAVAVTGSLGDLHPLLGLGQALKDRGAVVSVCAVDDHGSKIRGAGLEFCSIGQSFATASASLGLTSAEMIEKAIRDQGFLIEKMITPFLDQSMNTFMPLAEKADAIIGTSISFGAYAAALKLGKPFIATMLSPAVIMSAYDPAYTPAAPFILAPSSPWQYRFNRLLYSMGNVVYSGALKGVNQFYDNQSVPSRARLGGVVSESLNLALYSPLFGEVKPDFPPHTQVCGSVFFDSETGAAPRLSPIVEAFLDAGPPPLVFGLGSVASYVGESYFRQTIAAVRLLKARAILLTGEMSPLLREDFGPDILVVPYAPHSLLFPRAEIVIHHGGMGSTTQALRSGRPQLITPVFADQFDNAYRAERTGAAMRLPFSRYSARRAVKAIRRLRDDPNATRQAARLAPHISSECGASRAAELVLAQI